MNVHIPKPPCAEWEWSRVDYFVVIDFTWGGLVDHLKCNQLLQSDCLSVSILLLLQALVYSSTHCGLKKMADIL